MYTHTQGKVHLSSRKLKLPIGDIEMKLFDLIKEIEPKLSDDEVRRLVEIFQVFVSPKLTNNLNTQTVSTLRQFNKLTKEAGIANIW